MTGNGLLAAVLIFPLLFGAGGCMVASSKYDLKTKEVDTLRDALAACNKERSIQEARIEAHQTQIAAARKDLEVLAVRAGAREEEARRLNEELSTERKSHEGSRITREQYISELLEKEKATGKRIQELVLNASTCQQELESVRKGTAKVSGPPEPGNETGNPQGEDIRRERDILLGRVERLSEERRIEEKRRENRFESLKESIGKISRDVKVTTLGPTLEIYLPGNLIHPKGKAGLSDLSLKVITMAGTAASEFKTASFLVSTGSKKTGDEIRAALKGKAKLSEDRILVKLIEKEKGAELLLLVP